MGAYLKHNSLIYIPSWNVASYGIRKYDFSPLDFVEHFHVYADKCIDGYKSDESVRRELEKLIVNGGAHSNIQSIFLERPVSHTALSDFALAGEMVPRAALVLDFSLREETYEAMLQYYDFVVVCDHHQNVEEVCARMHAKHPDKFFYYYDDNKSGCLLTLDFLSDFLKRDIGPTAVDKWVDKVDRSKMGRTSEERIKYFRASSALGRLFDMSNDERAIITMKELAQKSEKEILAYGAQYVAADIGKALKVLRHPAGYIYVDCDGIKRGYRPVVYADIEDPQGGRMIADLSRLLAKRYNLDANGRIIGKPEIPGVYDGFFIIVKEKTLKSGKTIIHLSYRSPEDGVDVSLVATNMGKRALVDQSTGDISVDEDGNNITACGGGGRIDMAASQCDKEYYPLLYIVRRREYIDAHPDPLVLSPTRPVTHHERKIPNTFAEKLRKAGTARAQQKRHHTRHRPNGRSGNKWSTHLPRHGMA